MNVIRADDMGMCFGVRDALLATEAISKPATVTIHGELVHNPLVARRLEAAGFQQSSEEARAGAPATPVVLITAHGVSQAERDRLTAANKELIDTTCPLVRRAHDAAQQLQREGRHVLLIGKAGHVEVQGVVGDLTSYDVIDGTDAVREYPHPRLGIVCQTTMPPGVVADVCACIRRKNPTADVRFVDTVCQPTKLRQAAVLSLVQRVDAVVVVGGRNSNNTRWLVQVCREHEKPALHVECASDLDPVWFTGFTTVGLTAGTSTLDATIDEVESALARIETVAVGGETHG